MARPTIPTITAGQEGWDALINDIITALTQTPLPVAEYADSASFPAASSYDRCIVVATDTSKLYISNGSTWELVGTQS